MKVIFSRKGFDSSNGGYPSPILPDLRLVSLPIPWETDEHKYSDLHLDSSRTYYDLMSGLETKIKLRKKWIELTENTKCHLDPDINLGTIKDRNSAGWTPCFGQINGAKTHLANQGVEEGDLFLFFGWFKQTKSGKDERIVFDKDAPYLHVIFGYLQIRGVINNEKIPNLIKRYPSLKNHPHVASEESRRNYTNTIYVAQEKLTWNDDISGAGIFKFNKKPLKEYGLVLTKEKCSRSKWCLPPFFENVKISYHSRDSWRKREGYFQSAPIGQEFVVEDNPSVKEWAKRLIEENRT